MSSELPTIDDLKNLPFRARIAYVVRCARRVQPVFQNASKIVDFDRHAAAVENALLAAERFCAGENEHIRWQSSSFFHDTFWPVNVAAGEACRAANFVVDAASRAHPCAYASLAACSAWHACWAASTFAAAAHRDDPGYVDHPAYVNHADWAVRYTVKLATRLAAQIPAAAPIAALITANARIDYDCLLTLQLGKYPDLGNTIDATKNGPLGLLWPNGAPEWPMIG